MTSTTSVGYRPHENDPMQDDQYTWSPALVEPPGALLPHAFKLLERPVLVAGPGRSWSAGPWPCPRVDS